MEERMVENETVTLSRECEATEIPAGRLHVIPAGTPVRITQALGGSYTVVTDRGYMFRIDAKNADALGVTNSTAAAAGPEEFSDKLVWDQLRMVYDPEIPVNIVDLGLIYSCQITAADVGHKIEVKMSLTAPGCGMGEVLRQDVERRLRSLPGVSEVKVEVVFDPPWDPTRMSDAAKLQLGLDLGPSDSAFPVYNQH
jgi:probable FeS assembly SUF system protein SufT